MHYHNKKLKYQHIVNLLKFNQYCLHFNKNMENLVYSPEDIFVQDVLQTLLRYLLILHYNISELFPTDKLWTLQSCALVCKSWEPVFSIHRNTASR